MSGSHLQQGPGGPKLVLVLPFPMGARDFFLSEPWSAGNSSRPTRRKFQNLEFDVCLIMDQLEKSGLKDLMGATKSTCPNRAQGS